MLSCFVVALYVGVAVYGTPQEWLQTTMHSAEATCINVWRGVGGEFSTTRTT